MTTVALVSTKGSPGATTAALALAAAWSATEPTLLAEADPDGGDLAARCGLAVDGPGLTSLSIAGRHDGTTPNAIGHCQPFGSMQLPIVIAPSGPQQTTAALRVLGSRLHDCLEATEHMIFVDAGRLRMDSPAMPLVTAADAVIVVARPTLFGAEATMRHLASLSEAGVDDASVLLVGERPYRASEFTGATNADVLCVLADDRRGAMALFEAPDAVLTRRSSLLRDARSAVTALRERLAASTAGVAR